MNQTVSSKDKTYIITTLRELLNDYSDLIVTKKNMLFFY